jgi:hypothetical protein
MVIKQGSLLRQQNTAGAAQKETAAKTFFQFLDGFADGRLADIQLLSGLGYIPGVCNGIKYPVG